MAHSGTLTATLLKDANHAAHAHWACLPRPLPREVASPTLLTTKQPCYPHSHRLTDLGEDSGPKERQLAYKPACDTQPGTNNEPSQWESLFRISKYMCTFSVDGESWGQRAMLWRGAGHALSIVSWRHKWAKLGGNQGSHLREMESWNRSTERCHGKDRVEAISIYFPWCSAGSSSCSWTPGRATFVSWQ